MGLLRALAEVLGLAGIAALHVFAAVLYALGGDLVRHPARRLFYWIAIGLGYAAMVAVAAGRRRLLGDIAWRTSLDAWLIAFPPAAAGTVALVVARWPWRFAGWDAHGMGASGGEVNALVQPWLHLAGWCLVGRAWGRWSERAT
jgi:hypothetical protein